MENKRSQPIVISEVLSDSIVDQGTKEGRDEWEELEQFWGKENRRISLQEDNYLSSSLEKQLLNDECLKEPKENKQNELLSELQSKTIRGEDLKDIPTSYTVDGFKPHELIVIGTCVDKDILPGFRYKVRKNHAEEYLFKGKAKYLENIGLGYGKRLIFEGDSLNENNNYFWSDCAILGYGLTLQTINDEDIFTILDTKTGREIGRVLVNNPTVKEDVVLTNMVGDQGYVEKEVEVYFNCDVIFNDSNGQNVFIDDITVKGKAVLVRESMSSKAKVSQIFLEDFIQDSCLLLPVE